jgi:hypothetical protein
LILALRFKLSELRIIHPVNAIDRAGVDRLLNHLFRVAILTNGPSTAIFRLDVKGAAGDVGAVGTADAGQLIDVNPLLANGTAQLGLQARAMVCIPKRTAQLGLQARRLRAGLKMIRILGHNDPPMG